MLSATVQDNNSLRKILRHSQVDFTEVSSTFRDLYIHIYLLIDK